MKLALIFVLACGSSTPPARAPNSSTSGDRLSTQSAGVRMRWEMDSEAELTGSGWHRWSSGTSTFADGILTTAGNGYEEWMQRDDRGPSAWFETVDSDRGFVIETRMRIVRADAECASVGMWIHDRTRFFRMFVRDGSVGIDKAAFWHPLDTHAWHVYRIEGRYDWIRFSVDDEVVFQERSERFETSGGTIALNFGDLGGCRGSEARWDWLAYDTGPQLEDPPCESCTRNAEFRLAQLRTRLTQHQIDADLTNTSGADLGCLAYVGLDYVVQNIAPHLPTGTYAYMAEAILQAPRVTDASTAGELARFIQQQLDRPRKPRAEEAPPSDYPPPWTGPMIQMAQSLERGVSGPTWRQLHDFAVMGMQAEPAQDASARMLRALADAARGACAR